MSQQRTYDQVKALAPSREPIDQDWSAATLHRIVATPQQSRQRSRARLIAGGLAVGVIAATAGTAVAGVGPAGVVKEVLIDFSRQSATSGNGFGEVHDPELVARFSTNRGVFAVWVATSSTGKVCNAVVSGWDGIGVPSRSELEYGCNPMILDASDPDRVIEMTRPDQLGGFLQDDDGLPIVYGVSPYPQAVQVRVQGVGVDRKLPVRADSQGYGAAFPEVPRPVDISLTFTDAAGRVLGTKRILVPND